MPQIVAVVETSLYANDLQRAEAFYRDVLGLTHVSSEAGRHVFFRAGPASMLLIFHAAATLAGDKLPAHGSSGPGHVALGIAAEDLSAWRDRLAEHDVAVEQEVQWPRGGRSLYFRDPAGNLLELLTPGLWGLPSGW